MSVAMFVGNAISEKEEKFYVPIATEDFFEKYWLPGCKAIKLKWIPIFQTGVDLVKSDSIVVTNELQSLLVWAEMNLDTETYQAMRKRIELVIEGLSILNTRPDIELSIG